MAKLNGVTTVDMINGEITKIAYEGSEFVLSDDEPEVGDIIRTKKGREDVTRGAYYEVVEDRLYSFTTIKDDVGEGHSNVFDDGPVVFRKVPAEVSPPFAEMLTSKIGAVEDEVSSLVERVAALEVGKTEQVLEKGMRVKVLRDGQYGDVHAGDIGTIFHMGRGDDYDKYSVEVRTNVNYDFFYPQDLEIIPEVVEKVSYKPSRKPVEFKKGDIVRILEISHTASRNKPGDVGEIVDEDGCGYFVSVPFRTGESTFGNHHVIENLELVCFVENREDIAKGER